MSLGVTRGTIGKLYASYHAFEAKVSDLFKEKKIDKKRYKKLEKVAWEAYENQEGMLAKALKER